MNLRLVSLHVGLLVSLGALAGCNDDDGRLVASSDKPQQNVLVIDDGFDPSVDGLKRRIAGLYSITCAPSMPSSNTMPPANFDEAKSRALASLRMRDESCHLTDGVKAKTDPLANIAKYRDRWNQMVRDSQYGDALFSETEFNEISSALDSELPKAHFHGTATSGVIAHENPNVRLVLVEEPLGDATTAMQNFMCIKQEDIDQTVALFSDPEVHQAMIDQPTSTLDEELSEVMRRHDVGVINESFGSFTRQFLEELQAKKGCAPVDLKHYFALQAEITRARDQAHPLPDALLVKSAGNDHSRIDAPEDAILCGSAAGPRLAVGAYDLTQRLAEFTNFGGCVDAFAPGVSVIGPIPGGWLLPVNGTSFSAPLVARLVSLDGSPFSTQGAHDAVVGAIDGERRVPMARFPRSIFYDPRHVIGARSLTTNSPLVTAAMPQLRFSERQLRQLLAPLQLGR